MTLLEDIQNAAIDSQSDLGTLLRKCKLLAARLGSQPLEEFLLWESNGYPDDVKVPDYRIWSLEVKGHFAGPFQSGLRNAPVPLPCLPEKGRESYERYKCRYSIASIEAILEKCKTGNVQVSTGDLSLVLGTNVYEHQNCIQAWAEFGTSHLVELLNVVRNRILDFALALWKEAPMAGDAYDGVTKLVESKRVRQIFNTKIYSGSANILGTVDSSINEINVGINDLLSVERVLKEKGVSEQDLVELRTAVDIEGQLKVNNGFGPKISSWIAKMMGKAADGSWNIGLGAAGNLLSQVIAKYYGL
jgi:AbiTii